MPIASVARKKIEKVNSLNLRSCLKAIFSNSFRISLGRKNAKEKKRKTTAQHTAPQDTTDERDEQHVADWAHGEDDKTSETTASEESLWNRFQ